MHPKTCDSLIDCCISLNEVFISQRLFQIECGCIGRNGVKKCFTLCAVCDAFDSFEFLGNFEAHAEDFFVAER